MRTILLLLLSINCYGQQLEERDNTYEHGITIQKWVITSYGVFCFFETDKLSDYVDIKVKVARERIQHYPELKINTNAGVKYIPIYKFNKNGFAIFRLFYRLKDVWGCIDTGIASIEVKTDKKWHKISINDNLTKLKNYGRVPKE